MKKTIFLAFLTLALFSCDNDDPTNPDNDNLNGVISTLTTSTGVRIIEFVEDGVNETSDYDQFLFIFNTDGSVVASKQSQTIEGTFLVFEDDGRIELRMNFPSNSELSELSDDWYFISQDQNTIRFDDGIDDILQFQIQ